MSIGRPVPQFSFSFLIIIVIIGVIVVRLQIFVTLPPLIKFGVTLGFSPFPAPVVNHVIRNELQADH